MNDRHEKTTAPSPIARELDGALRRLAFLIRANVIVRGLSLLFLSVLGIVALSLVVDRVFRLPVPVRAVSLVVYLGVIAWLVWRWLISPCRVPLRPERLADLVERRHPDLLDTLRSSLDFVRDPRVRAESRVDDDLAVQMKREVARRTARDIHRIDVSSVIDTPRVVAALTAGCAAFALALALAVPLGETLALWFERQVLLSATAEWPYRTRLVAEGFSPPEFTRGVPSGDPLVLRVRADGELPRRVRIRLDFGSERRRLTLARESDRMFVFEVDQVLEEFRFVLEGGDFRSPVHTVRPLARPRVEELALQLVFPPHTHRAEESIEDDVGDVSVPEGTTIHLRGRASKPLRAARLEAEDEAAPLVVTAGDENEFRGVYKPVSGGAVSIVLEDTERVPPERPFRFFVHVLPDRAPSVRARPRGVSGLVTPAAMIPLEVRAEDDYRVTQLSVAFEVVEIAGEESEASEDASSAPPDESSAEAAAEGGDSPEARRGEEPFPPLDPPAREFEDVLVWDLLPHAFEPGIRIDLRVRAVDNNAIRGAQTGESSRLAFLVVTPERLGEELLRREVEQRRALERALTLEKTIRDRVYSALNSTWRADGELAGTAIDEIVAAAKTQRQLSRQLAAIAGAIRQILDEMKNNRIAEAEDSERLAAQIISPLDALAAEALPETVTLLRRVREERSAPARAESGWELAQGVDAVIEELERIIRNLRRMEGFTEIVHRLRSILSIHKEATAETRRLYEATVDSFFEDDELIEEDEDAGDGVGEPAETSDNTGRAVPPEREGGANRTEEQ